MTVTREDLAGHPPGMWQGHVLGAGMPQCPTAGLPLSPPNIPCSTGGDYATQIVDGKADKSIPARAEAREAHEAQPARRGEMRASDRGGGAGITMQDHGPVCTRTVGGREEIVYKTSEMEEGRLYAVEWNGGHYALRKSGQNVEIFKFRADDGGDQDKG